MAQSLACTGLCSLLWFVVGYSLSFAGDGAWLGTFERAVPARHRHGRDQRRLRRPSRNSLFMFYQMTFAIITVALVAGSVADRMRFSAFLWFAAGWLHPRLCADRALGVGRRFSRQGGPARFRRRHGRPSQCRRRGAGRGLRGRQAARLRHGQFRALRPVAGGDRHRPAVGRLVRVSTAARRSAPIRAPSSRSSRPISRPPPAR